MSRDPELLFRFRCGSCGLPEEIEIWSGSDMLEAEAVDAETQHPLPAEQSALVLALYLAMLEDASPIATPLAGEGN